MPGANASTEVKEVDSDHTEHDRFQLACNRPIFHHRPMDDEGLTIRQRLVRAALYLALLLSPIGAPAVGFLILAACPSNAAIVPSGPFAMPFSHCGLPGTVEHFYQWTVFMPVVVFANAGPIIGGMLALLWVVSGAAIAILFGWHLLRALFCLAVERL